jgi:hypothetical protein
MLVSKAINVIGSCKTLEQLEVANKYTTLTIKKLYKTHSICIGMIFELRNIINNKKSELGRR